MRPGALVGDRFAIERLAGEGGMGVVYRAVDRASGAPVALKILREREERARERFEREARVLAELRHPRIVRYIDHGTSPDGAWLAMEWIDGELLADRLHRAALGVDETLAVSRAVAEGLAALHERAIVHRDVKPSNILLAGGAVEGAVLLDLGIVRGLGRDERSLTRTGAVVGTLGYLAPEQTLDGAELDARVDVFSLGCVMFECLTGQAAFQADRAVAVLAKVLLEETPRARDRRAEVPAALDELVARMMEKQPAGRPADGTAVLRELEAVASGSLRPAPPGALTRSEQRVLTVLLASKPAPTDPDVPSAERNTVDWRTVDTGELERLGVLVAAYGGRLERLDRDAMIVTLPGHADATEQVIAAAKCALALRAVLPGAALSLATGRAEATGRALTGEVIDRAARQLAPTGVAGAVEIDAATAGLLDERFEVVRDGSGVHLLGERDAIALPPTLQRARGAFVGRGRELATLVGYVDDWVGEPRAGAVVVVAPPGTGKSRLASELVATLAARSVAPSAQRAPVVWVGRGDPLRTRSPFGVVVQLVRSACAIGDADPLPARRDKLAARLSRRLSGEPLARAIEFLGELAATPVLEPSAALRSARRDPQQMAARTRAALESWLAAECADAPLLVVLEDLHWMDAPSVALVLGAVEELSDRPLVVLGLARPELDQALPRLASAPGLVELRLPALSPRASEALVRDVLGADASSAVVGRITVAAAGNALYLEELARAAKSGLGEALPETVLAMVASRIDDLDVEQRRVLRAASIFGRVFWEGGVATLLGGEARRPTVRRWLSSLSSLEVVSRRAVSRFAPEAEYSFHHALIRDAAYALLTQRDRSLGHRLAAEWLERAGVDPLELAEHFERGGEGDRAARAYLDAAKRALGHAETSAALALACRGIACGATGELRGALRAIEGVAQKWLGAPVAALEASEDALSLLPRGCDAWYEAALTTVAVASQRGPKERVLAVADELFELAREAPPSGAPRPNAVRVAATSRVATVLAFIGELERGRRVLATVRSEVDALADEEPSVLAHFLKARAMLALFDGALRAAYLDIERAIDCFERASDPRGACLERGNAGNIAVEAGAFDEAEALLRRNIADAGAIGLGPVVAMARSMLGCALVGRGALGDAAREHAQAIATFNECGDRRMEGSARTYMAECSMLGGDLEGAEEHARAAVALLEVAPPLRPRAWAQLARVLLRRGRAEEALDAARLAHDALVAMGSIEEGESLVRLAWAEALAATGHDAPARAAVELAASRIRARAATIDDPGWRAAFLAVRDNARTLELAGEAPAATPA